MFFFGFALDAEKDEPEPSKLSLSERIKMFNMKMSEERAQKRDVPRRRLSRFQTQPVTSEEVESAKCITPPPLVLGLHLFCFVFCASFCVVLVDFF